MVNLSFNVFAIFLFLSTASTAIFSADKKVGEMNELFAKREETKKKAEEAKAKKKSADKNHAEAATILDQIDNDICLKNEINNDNSEITPVKLEEIKELCYKYYPLRITKADGKLKISGGEDNGVGKGEIALQATVYWGAEKNTRLKAKIIGGFKSKEKEDRKFYSDTILNFNQKFNARKSFWFVDTVRNGADEGLKPFLIRKTIIVGAGHKLVCDVNDNSCGLVGSLGVGYNQDDNLTPEQVLSLWFKGWRSFDNGIRVQGISKRYDEIFDTGTWGTDELSISQGAYSVSRKRTCEKNGNCDDSWSVNYEASIDASIETLQKAAAKISDML